MISYGNNRYVNKEIRECNRLRCSQRVPNIYTTGDILSPSGKIPRDPHLVLVPKTVICIRYNMINS